jgi:hypothetical protein
LKSAAITIERLASAFDATPPGHLFHYTDLEGVKGIFTSRMLWMSKFTATNDISEIKLAIEHFQTFAARKARTLDGGEGAFLRKAAEQLEGFRRTNICLASFCEQHDLLSQWRSYGNDGRGVALGFNCARLLEVAQRNGLRLLRCVYEPAEHERISASLTDMLLEARRASPAGDGGDLIAQFNDVFLRVAPVIKDHRFGEEREWRLVSSPVAFDHPAIIAVLKGNQASVKLTVKLTGDSEGMSNMIPRITIGPTLDPHNVSDAIDVLSQRNGFHIPDIGISEIPYRRIAE